MAEMNFTTKDKWCRETSALCLHCGQKIEYRPCTVGISKEFGAIKTEGYFCCFPCVVRHCRDNGYFQNNVITHWTQTIYQQFKKNIDASDSIPHMEYIADANHILAVPASPKRCELQAYGGRYPNDYIWQVMKKAPSKPAKKQPAGGLKMSILLSDT